MWHNFLEKGKTLAEQAKKAAVDIDSKLNEAVGIEHGGASSASASASPFLASSLTTPAAAYPSHTTSASLPISEILNEDDDDDGGLNVDNAWDDDDDLELDVPLSSEKKKEEEQSQPAAVAQVVEAPGTATKRVDSSSATNVVETPLEAVTTQAAESSTGVVDNEEHPLHQDQQQHPQHDETTDVDVVDDDGSGWNEDEENIEFEVVEPYPSVKEPAVLPEHHDESPEEKEPSATTTTVIEQPLAAPPVVEPAAEQQLDSSSSVLESTTGDHNAAVGVLPLAAAAAAAGAPDDNNELQKPNSIEEDDKSPPESIEDSVSKPPSLEETPTTEQAILVMKQSGPVAAEDHRGDGWVTDDGDDLDLTTTEMEEAPPIEDSAKVAESTREDEKPVIEPPAEGAAEQHVEVSKDSVEPSQPSTGVDTEETTPVVSQQPRDGSIPPETAPSAGVALTPEQVETLREESSADQEGHPSSSSSSNQKHLLDEQQEITRILEQKLDELHSQLKQREEQLVSKTEQLTMIQAMHESEKEELRMKIQNTKEEAKKRIQKAKDRVETMEFKLKTATAAHSSSAGDAAQQAEIIAALRTEGETLARRQAEMEKAVRSAKGEARELKEKLEDEMQEKENALDKISKLETEMKTMKEDLASARKGESQAGKLEADLQHALEESERKGSSILSLEQQLKELKAESKDLMAELEDARKGAAIETQREQKKIRKEHNEVISDLENKLRTSEREAAVREDALRHEVDELRKRWQDAVRRADALSMDIQSSTAPLLRQLESAERQNRARAAAAAEIETKLRSELEETVIANEKLTKERGEWKTKFSRLERTAKENEDELRAAKLSLDEKSSRVKQLEDKLRDMEIEGAKMKEQWAEVERLANEGVSRVRSEMTQTVVESEDRYRAQLDALQAELSEEREKRRQLEDQVDELVENAGMIVPPTVQQVASIKKEAKPKRLGKTQAQAEILVGALNGLGGTYEEDNEENGEEEDGLMEEDGAQQGSSITNNFAALEELSSRLKAAKVELNALRKTLADSEQSREQLAEELGESRSAKEKLPLFEVKVQELTTENKEQALEIQALQEDIAEVRELYRTQLNVLLEEKAAESKTPPAEAKTLNGDKDNVVQAAPKNSVPLTVN